MMTRMSDDDRQAWLAGTTKQQQAVNAAVRRGDHQCDGCEAPAVAIGYGGEPVRVDVRCASCFLAWLRKDRENRPSRDELVARVNAAIGVA